MTDSTAAATQAHLFWEGSFWALNSLALVNREHCRNLQADPTIELTLIPYAKPEFSAEEMARWEALAALAITRKGLKSGNPAAPRIWIRQQWPPVPIKPPGGARWVVLQPWEYSILPKPLVETFRRTDEIWTHSNFSRNAFVASGIDPAKIHVVPDGVDAELFTPDGPPFPLPTTKRFKFLFVGGTIYRKGLDVLLDSYFRSFTAADDVCLVIKDVATNTLYRGQTLREHVLELQRMPDGPQLVYIDDPLPESELAALYRSCNAFVSSYRGEGFSLPSLEAMACGLPAIVTAGGSTDDFVDETVGWRIPARPRSIGHSIYRQELAQEGFLLEPDGAALDQLLITAFNDPDQVSAKGQQATRRARTDWTWQQGTAKLRQRIAALCGAVEP